MALKCWKCVYRGCTCTSTSEQLRSFHKIPVEEPRHTQWLNNIGRKDLAEEDPRKVYKNYRVCSDHFSETCFTNTLSITEATRRRLHSFAVPHIVSETFVTGEPEQNLTEGEPKAKKLHYQDDIPRSSQSVTFEGEAPFTPVAAHLDHDYIADRKSARELLLESQQKLLEEKNIQYVLEKNLKRDLCRICGQKGLDLVPIFEISLKNKDVDLDLSSKIAVHLPLKVTQCDTLPLCICGTCSDLINSWHELYVTCVATDAVLQKTFGIQNDDVPSDNSSNSFSRTEDKMEHPVTINILGNDMKTLFEMDTSLLLNDTYKKCNEICEKHGKNNSKEAKLECIELQDLFDNFENINTTCHYYCKICRDRFESTRDRRNHFMMCRQLSTICDICGVNVQHRKDLTRHKSRTHFKKKVKSVRKIHLCEKCAKCFRSDSALRKHMYFHEHSTPKHVCKLCCRLFYSDLSYSTHMKKHEEGKIKSVFPPGIFMINEDTALHICPVCQQKFDSELTLAIHLSSKKQMKCVKCKKKIVNEKRSLLHICKKWICQYCPRSFCEKKSLVNHERIHTGQKPYKCNLCDAMFRSISQRIQHQTVHDSPVLNCNFCSKMFKNKYIFRDHVNSHLGLYISCKLCEKRFSSRKLLYKHNARFHRNKGELS